MARIRSIHPGFAKSADIAALSLPCQMHFARLWTYADDHGRGKDDARLIKAECWPLEDSISVRKVEAMQVELAANGRIIRYEVDGTRYFQVTNWAKFQRPQKPRPSEYPSVPRTVAVPDSDDTPPLPVSLGIGGEKEKEGNGIAPAVPSQRKPDRLWDALMDACGVQPEDITESSRGAYNRAVSELRKLGVEPEEVHHRAAAYRMRWTVGITPTALVRRWAECSNGAALQPRVNGNQAALMRAQARGQ